MWYEKSARKKNRTVAMGCRVSWRRGRFAPPLQLFAQLLVTLIRVVVRPPPSQEEKRQLLVGRTVSFLLTMRLLSPSESKRSLRGERLNH
jgi:hypothetical protein